MTDHLDSPPKKRLVARLVRKAHQDETFCKALRRNPRKKIEEELGHALPHPLKIKVLQETEGIMYIVLPWYGPEGKLSKLEKARSAAIWIHSPKRKP